MLILGHVGRPPAPHDIWGAWDPDPLVLSGLVVAWLLYRRGTLGDLDPASRRRSRRFGVGLVVVALAVISPLDTMGSALASAHMVQHLLLMLVAAPLLALGVPGSTILRGVSRPVRKQLGRLRRVTGLTPSRTSRLAQPLAVWIAYTSALWIWHMPSPYGAAVDNELVHSIEHLSFLVTAFLFWRLTLLELDDSRGLAVLGVFTAALQGTILAALLTFSRSPWYSQYMGSTSAWGLTAIADQQLAGVIMWVPGGLIYLAFGLTLFASWLQGSDGRLADSRS